MQVSKANTFAPVSLVKNYTVTPKPVTGWFPDVFKKTNIDDVKELKTKDGNPRFNKQELKEIKSYVKKNKLDTTTVKHLSETMLDVKSMSEAYSFAQNTKNPMQEIGFIKANVKQFEKPYEKWSDAQREGIHTHLTCDDNNTYKINNDFNTRGIRYKENGKFVSSYEITSGPYWPDTSDEDSSSTVTTKTNSNDDWDSSPLNPLNPNSPLNPMYS